VSAARADPDARKSGRLDFSVVIGDDASPWYETDSQSSLSLGTAAAFMTP